MFPTALFLLLFLLFPGATKLALPPARPTELCI
jgi:hypothetical protein